MHKLWWSSVLLIVRAASAPAQGPLVATTPPVDRLTLGTPELARQTSPFLARERVHADTARSKSRRRQVIGAALGAVVGGVPGGAYAFLEATSGCKAMVGPPPCNKPRHLWAYPVGGAAVGALIGALIARF